MDKIEAALRDLNTTSTALIQSMTDLRQRVDVTEKIQKQQAELLRAQTEQQDTNMRQKRTNVLLGTSILLDVVLSAALGYSAWRIDHNADAIQALQTESVTQDCAEKALWLGLIDKEMNDPEEPVTEDERALLEGYKATFQTGYDNLNCDSHLPKVPTD